MKNAKYIEKNPKYKKGDFVKLIENNLKVENLVHILDVKMESLSINTFYSLHPESVKNCRLKEKMVDKSIVKTYNNYLHPLLEEQSGDMIFLVGVLEGGTYEMVLFEVFIEEGVKKFQIRYFVDCSDSWISQQTFFQGFAVKD